MVAKSKGSSKNLAVRALGVLAAALLLCAVARRVDAGDVLALLGGLGFYSALLLVPSIFAVGLDVFAWQNSFSLLGARPAFWSLSRVRIVSESIGAVLPLGALWADAVKPRLLARECGTGTSMNVAAVAARKYQLVVSQAVYLALGFVLGHEVLARSFERTVGSSLFALTLLVASAALFGLSEALASSFRGGSTLSSVLRVAVRIPCGALRRRLASVRSLAERADGAAARYFAASLPVRAGLAAPCLAAWLLEATETWTILHVLGANLSWGDAVGVEALVVLARNALAILPGGLGAQELGYATLLSGAGVDSSVSSALMLLKRAREGVWLFAGTLLFFSGTAALEGHATEPEVAPSVAE